MDGEDLNCEQAIKDETKYMYVVDRYMYTTVQPLGHYIFIITVCSVCIPGVAAQPGEMSL